MERQTQEDSSVNNSRKIEINRCRRGARLTHEKEKAVPSNRRRTFVVDLTSRITIAVSISHSSMFFRARGFIFITGITLLA